MTPKSKDRTKVNIITGFLGVGKTTLIQRILETKPADERWAILVNEFGEIGIDGAFYHGHPQDGIYVREVPGGCMCCTSGLPMQIALNQLLQFANPHRLFIEPTGLGHPKEVVAALDEPQYREMLDLRATFTLVDARKIAHAKYSEHPTFQQQLHIADQILMTKTDLYEANESQQLADYLRKLGLENVPVSPASFDEIDLASFDAPCVAWRREEREHSHDHEHEHHHHDSHDESTTQSSSMDSIAKQLAERGFAAISNQGERFFSHGWVFAPKHNFDFDTITKSLTHISVERLKAVLITNKGVFSFNLMDGQLELNELDESPDSRLEFITDSVEHARTIKQSLESEIFSRAINC